MVTLLTPEISHAPYPYFTSPQALEKSAAQKILDWLKSTAFWNYHEENFFEQFETEVKFNTLPAEFQFEGYDRFPEIMKEKAAMYFNTQFEDQVKVVAHKLVNGQSIGIHNDNPTGTSNETHRIIIHFNEGFEDSYGGHFIVFNTPPSLDNIHAVLRPVHNSAIGFAASEYSYHAINKIENWERYSIVFSFWEKKELQHQAFNIIDHRNHRIYPYLNFLINNNAAEISHSHSSLLSHLIDTYTILRHWKCPDVLCKAGLFHSIYGTQEFKEAPIDLESRQKVIALIGKKAERIAYLYCICDREKLYDDIFNGKDFFKMKDLNGSIVALSKSDFSSLITLDLANTLEQIDRVDVGTERMRKEREIYLKVLEYLPKPSIELLESSFTQFA